MNEQKYVGAATHKFARAFGKSDLSILHDQTVIMEIKDKLMYMMGVIFLSKSNKNIINDEHSQSQKFHLMTEVSIQLVVGPFFLSPISQIPLRRYRILMYSIGIKLFIGD